MVYATEIQTFEERQLENANSVGSDAEDTAGEAEQQENKSINSNGSAPAEQEEEVVSTSAQQSTNSVTDEAAPPKKKPRNAPSREKLLEQLARGRETARKNRESGACVLPLRNIKRIMKLNEDVGTVQNEAAILVQYVAEMFTKKLALDSLETAKQKGRGGNIKYEDIAETRASHENLSFLEPLLP
uniref:Transcription factor CBF/NF-Y/archaeal histone domain-containing protein n=1 Tax=Leptocylindrus danicus TaxID=163516 RepID=A0A7S2JVB9_9STRA|mmetsp:Transcript_12088/g.18235  ORF Transcript_12088/g.18235 Transcript_12088/m.18235 type:complete len:186 (+) Transcript_12088:58-615(+)|eukprot:CAMPEP_0116028764 /NCGR_PEP_ID=MMETSP0321-20121206/15662_1 /TAXON_ID=163516 /ORGANISM="Leptocylindrus danicus var. danicus, Strain B650" /LENGTH=185 /DNA_ID=CAMNT_0003502859 /DNA_START=17 /DNA_END=574 /DNA_ORIENTATION=-